jgi:hypothetical protein
MEKDQNGRKHEFCLDLEIVAEFGLPLLGKLGRTENRKAFDFATVE